MTTFNGKINGNGLKIGIVVARFNAFVTQQLLTGAQEVWYSMGSMKPILTWPGYRELLRFH
ncbi:hypothetical protein TUA1478L_34400 [Lactiplantibacillus plantarum]